MQMHYVKQGESWGKIKGMKKEENGRKLSENEGRKEMESVNPFERVDAFQTSLKVGAPLN